MIEDEDEKYANPRNLASGTLNLDDAEEVKNRKVHFHAFTLVYVEEEMNSWGQRMDFLENMKFTVVDREETNAATLPQVVEKWTKRVEDGKMDAGKKYRGKMSKVVLDYVKDMELELLNAKPERVFITHSGCEANIIDEVYKYLEQLGVFKEILVTRAGSVISSHCGPGTLGVLFIAQ